MNNISSLETRAAIVEIIEQAAFAPSNPAFQRHTHIQDVILDMRRRRRSLNRLWVRRFLQQWAFSATANLEPLIEGATRALDEVITHSRVLCLTEVPDDHVMWSRYAGEHRGVVLELNPYRPLSSPLSIARRVLYQPHLPQMLTPLQWARFIAGMENIHYGEEAIRCFCTKDTSWSHQREWRCFHAAKTFPPEDKGGILPRSITDEPCGLYLGMRMNSADKTEVIALAAASGFNLPIYEAHKAKQAYQIEFKLTKGVTPAGGAAASTPLH